MSISPPLILPRQIHNAMAQQAFSERPNECCGLLSGILHPDRREVKTRWPLPNAANSPSAYRVDAKNLFTSFREMRARGEELLAIYHSHPTSWAVPSRFDHADWNYGPDVACVILSLAGDECQLRAWSLDQNRHTEIEWRIAEEGEARL